MTSFGQSLIASVKEARAFVKGEDNGCVVHIPDPINTARIRGKLGMSQSEFADHFGLNVRTVQDWETGRAVPSGPAKVLLRVIDVNPDAVHRALNPIARRRANQRQKMLTKLFKMLMRANGVLAKYYFTEIESLRL